MAIERIPCGGWDIDTTTLQFQNKVLKVVGGTSGAYLPLSGGIMEANAIIEGTEELQIITGDADESGIIGVTQTGVTIEHNTNSQIDSSIKVIENTVEINASNTTVLFNETGVDFNGANITGLSSLTGEAGSEIVVETTLDMNNHNITNLAEPINPSDGATKQYVDNSLTAFRVRDLFGIAASGNQIITLPIERQNVLVVFYNVDPTGNANISNSKAVSVVAGAQEVSGDLTIDFNADGKTVTLTNANATDAILGQYYGYNA